MKKTLYLTTLYTLMIYSLLLLLISIIFILDKFNCFSKESLLFGFHYLPPVWIFICSFPAFLLLLFLKKYKTSLLTIIYFTLIFLTFGDFSFKNNKICPIENKLLGKKVSVSSINVRYFSYGFEDVLEKIRKINSDIVLLSEIILTENQIAYIKINLFPYQIAFGRNKSTGILSKFPIIDSKEIEFPTKQASLSKGNDIDKLQLNPNRAFIHSKININNVLTNVISVRFIAGRPKNKSINESLKWGKYLLCQQKKELNFFINYLKKLEGPIIFGGDFNAPPNSIIIKSLSKLAIDSMIYNKFWGGFTFDTKHPKLRLDYIFCLNNIIPTESKILKIKLSDHYPIMSNFLILSN